MKPKVYWQLLRRTWRHWNADKAPRLGAALAYYLVFSIAPLLVIAVGIAGLVFGEEAARGVVKEQFQSAIGSKAAEAIQDMISHTSRTGIGLLATVVGLATLLLGAAGAFWQIQDALNTVWKVAPRPGRGILGVVRDRVLAFLLVLVFGLVLLGSLAITTALAFLSYRLDISQVPGGLTLLHFLDWLVSFLAVTVLFAIIYQVLPDVKVRWRDVWPGAVLTALLFTAGKELIGLFLGYAGFASPFGAAESLVLILLWFYYSSQIFLFGAEFTREYAYLSKPPPEPTSNAVLVSPEELARQGIPRAGDVEAAARRASEGPGPVPPAR
jgi:membrane protein